MIECAHCAQPVQLAPAQPDPNYCPACGYKWRTAPPVDYKAPPINRRVACPHCIWAQKAGFAYCLKCGTAMGQLTTGGPEDDDREADDQAEINGRGIAKCRAALAAARAADGDPAKIAAYQAFLNRMQRKHT